jgi:hypothetical protein
VNPEIPQVVSEIVMKLMAKNAEERYQNAFGIKVHLEECLNHLHGSNNISVFYLVFKIFLTVFKSRQKFTAESEKLIAY